MYVVREKSTQKGQEGSITKGLKSSRAHVLCRHKNVPAHFQNMPTQMAHTTQTAHHKQHKP